MLLLVVALLSLVSQCGATEACDPLVPEYCMLPYPNDFWRVSTPNGYRLNISNVTFPLDDDGKGIDAG